MTGRKWWKPQRDALERIRGQSRVALFMEMRLGKTPVIIQWAQEQTANIARPRILVVGPGAVFDDWVDELLMGGVPLEEITRLDRVEGKIRMEYVDAAWGWFLCHKEGVRITQALSEIEWDVVIIDESTIIRNPQAQITKTMLRNYSHVPYRAILTGDPRPESELDYFTQMQFLHGHFMGFGGPGGYWQFRNTKFTQSRFVEWHWTPKPGLRDEIKTYIHEHAVVMTKQQYGMGNRIDFKRRTVEMNDRQHAAMRELAKDFSFEYIQTQWATVRDVWMARVAGGFSPDRENPELLSGAKADGIIELMHGELRGQPSVIWFRFNEELRYMVERLNNAKIPAIGVDGTTPKADRKPKRDRFNDGTYRVICIQVALGRMGWNLSRADVSQYYSFPYDWESRSQSLQRIEHMTKKRTLLNIDWVTRGSLDEEVVRLLKEKRMNSRAFMRQLNSEVMQRLRSQYGIESAKGKDQVKAGHQKKIVRVYPGR